MQITTDIISLFVSDFLRSTLPTSENQVHACMLSLHRDRESPFLRVFKMHHFTLQGWWWCLKRLSEADYVYLTQH